MATVQDVIDDVRALTSHDTDEQVTDAQLIPWISDVNDELWGDVTTDVPVPFLKVASPFTLSSGNTFDLSTVTDYDHAYRLDRLLGSVYRPILVADSLDPETATAGAFLERGGFLEVYPSQQAAGTYRLTYVPTTPELTAAGDPLPLAGTRNILAHRVYALVFCRDENEDRAPLHMQRADQLTGKYIAGLRKRYGAHVVPGLKRVWR